MAATETELPAALGVADIIARLRHAVSAGEQHWLLALLEAVRAWPLAEERVGERTYRYLVAGEAFDWLLLAERLCDELDGLIPEDEREGLLFHRRLPIEMDEAEFARQLGAKHRVHLNFVYGVRVEAALQLAVQEEVRKEQLSRVWENGHMDEETFHRIYGRTREELLSQWRRTRQPATGDEISLADLTEFTYWLFQRRVQSAEPARVASDTRKGLAMLKLMESHLQHRTAGVSL